MLLHVLGAKSRTSKYGLETPEATSSNLLVDKNIQSLKSEWESKCYNSGHTCAVD